LASRPTVWPLASTKCQHRWTIWPGNDICYNVVNAVNDDPIQQKDAAVDNEASRWRKAEDVMMITATTDEDACSRAVVARRGVRPSPTHRRDVKGITDRRNHKISWCTGTSCHNGALQVRRNRVNQTVHVSSSSPQNTT
jgi:hypothetical protein